MGMTMSYRRSSSCGLLPVDQSQSQVQRLNLAKHVCGRRLRPWNLHSAPLDCLNGAGYEWT